MSIINVKSIKRYLPRKVAYMDEDLRVWQPLKIDKQEFFYNGLNVRKEKCDVIGENIANKDLVIIFKTVIEATGYYSPTYKGIIMCRNDLINNLLI